MNVVIIKYNSGNIRSVSFALERIGVNALISNKVEDILSADKIIFPGVGEASTAMNYLREYKLDQLIVKLKQPVLGICLGMQLMCNYSAEGNTKCLGIFNQNIMHFSTNLSQKEFKIPHIGWNTIYNSKTNLFFGINENEYMYFVHSYYAELGINTIATTKYGIEYSSALQKDNFYATQFHPEKSGAIGQTILENFIKI